MTDQLMDFVFCSSLDQTLSNPDGITLQPFVSWTDVSQSQSCILSVDANPSAKVVVDAVDVICNARRVEMYASNGEYLSTSEGSRVDEELGCQRTAYMMPCSFEPSLQRCQLKVSTVVFFQSI